METYSDEVVAVAIAYSLDHMLLALYQLVHWTIKNIMNIIIIVTIIY